MSNNSLDVLCKVFREELTAVFSDHLQSIILYGSATGPDYIAGVSDHNFLVVLDDTGMAELDKARSLVTGWRKKKIAMPLFMSEQYIQASLDSFPIEFLNMQLSRRVVLGEDVIAELEINSEHLRLQAEREVKGYLLKLRQGLILSLGKASEMRALVIDSLSALTSLFRALLVLKNLEVPEVKQEVIMAACQAFGLDDALFRRLNTLRSKSEKIDKTDLDALLHRYIDEVAKLTLQVDQWNVQ